MRYLKSLSEIIRKLRFILTKKQRRTAGWVALAIIVGSFLEMLGVSAVLPFIEIILTPSAVLNKWYLKPITQGFKFTDTDSIIIVIGIVIIIVYFVKNLYLYCSTIFQARYRSKVQKELSTQILNAYMHKSYEDFISINTAGVVRGIGIDVTGVYNLLDNLFRFTSEFLTAVLIGLFLIYTDLFMAIFIIAVAGCCFALITIGLKRKTKYLSEQKRITDIERENCALQTVMGFKEIKVTQTTDYFVQAYNDAYEKQRIAEIKNEYIVNLPERVIEAMCVAALLGVICIKIAIGADMTVLVPKLAVFGVAAFRLLPSVSRMTRYMNGVIFNNSFLQSVYQNLVDIKGDQGWWADYKNGRESCCQTTKRITFEDKLELQNIEWEYCNREQKILSNLSMTIHKGKAVGIIGLSGAGKTTLADIILGLLEPKVGQVLTDGENIYQHPKEWSKIIGYVPQSIFLSDDTIRNNVIFGHSPDQISDEDVWNALKEAQMEEFVRNLPDQLDTQVGERGIKFSGGQQQRIAIARALYNNPDIIVLDEATSALDNDTERAVMEAIDALQGYKTLIIVAHRLTTIRRCDKIYEIKNGRAIERKWDEIAEK